MLPLKSANQSPSREGAGPKVNNDRANHRMKVNKRWVSFIHTLVVASQQECGSFIEMVRHHRWLNLDLLLGGAKEEKGEQHVIIKLRLFFPKTADFACLS